MGLVQGGRWIGGCAENTRTGGAYVPNIPTEELFCVPGRRRVSAEQGGSSRIGWNGGRAFPAAQPVPAPSRAALWSILNMSMPSFPPNGADLTREEALTMIIASIAMEELALSHIINAEGEKLQYILGTLPGAKPCATPQDVLVVNKSVASLLDVVAQNQMLLKNKLEKNFGTVPDEILAQIEFLKS